MTHLRAATQSWSEREFLTIYIRKTIKYEVLLLKKNIENEKYRLFDHNWISLRLKDKFI